MTPAEAARVLAERQQRELLSKQQVTDLALCMASIEGANEVATWRNRPAEIATLAVAIRNGTCLALTEHAYRKWVWDRFNAAVKQRFSGSALIVMLSPGSGCAPSTECGSWC